MLGREGRKPGAGRKGWKKQILLCEAEQGCERKGGNLAGWSPSQRGHVSAMSRRLSIELGQMEVRFGVSFRFCSLGNAGDEHVRGRQLL